MAPSPITEHTEDRRYGTTVSADCAKFIADVAKYHDVFRSQAADLIVRFVKHLVDEGKMTLDDLKGNPGSGPRFTPEILKIIDEAIDDFALALVPAGFNPDTVVDQLRNEFRRLLIRVAPDHVVIRGEQPAEGGEEGASQEDAPQDEGANENNE